MRDFGLTLLSDPPESSGARHPLVIGIVKLALAKRLSPVVVTETRDLKGTLYIGSTPVKFEYAWVLAMQAMDPSSNISFWIRIILNKAIKN